jgi:hypothetical protein
MPRCDRLSQVLELAQPGDVLLTSRPGWISTLIRFLSESPVSHAILVLPEREVVMAHLPRAQNETVVQRYTYRQLQSEEWIGMYCQRHQELEANRRALAKIVEIAERFEEEAKPGGGLRYRFGTVDMVIGATLCMLRPASSVIRWLALNINDDIERAIRKIFEDRGGSSELFCSEFVYRCFFDASNDEPSAAIDTSMLLLRDWAAIITGQQPLLLRPREELKIRNSAMTVSWLDSREPPPGLVGPEISHWEDVKALLLMMRDFIRSLRNLPGFVAGVADFVTPIDLLRSPTFRTVAWWVGP